MSLHPSDNSKVVRTLNWLLRGEISATQTYGLAIPQVADDRPSDGEVLRSIVREHEAVAQAIREAIQRHGGTPEETLTPAPGVVKTVSGPGKVFGQAAALKALRDSEVDGLAHYRHALDQLNAETSGLVRDAIIPARMKHITELEAMIARL